MIYFDQISVKTPKRECLVGITNDVQKYVRKSDIQEGVCRVFIPHTTAGVTINEDADPSVKVDISNFLGKLVPKGGGLGYSFKHGEGNSDSHVKSSLIGPSLTLLIHNGRLILGTWQGVYLVEFDGPRNRSVFLQVQGD